MVEGRLSEQDSWKVVGRGVVDESRKAAAVVCLEAMIPL